MHPMDKEDEEKVRGGILRGSGYTRGVQYKNFQVRYLLPSVLERELCVVIPGFVDGLQFAKYAVARVDIHSAGSVS